MRIGLFVKTFLVLFALALLVFYFTPDATLIDLVKYIALSIAISILFYLFYPGLRGIRRGDKVILVSQGILPGIFGRTAVAMGNARIGEELKIIFKNGSEAIGIAENYEGFFSPPKVRVLFENRGKKNAA